MMRSGGPQRYPAGTATNRAIQPERNDAAAHVGIGRRRESFAVPIE